MARANKNDYNKWSNWFREQILFAFAATFTPPPAVWAARKGDTYNEFAKTYAKIWNNDILHIDYNCLNSGKKVKKPLRIRLQDFLHSSSDKVDTSIDHIEQWWKRETMLSNQVSLCDQQGNLPVHPKVALGQKGTFLLALLYWFEEETQEGEGITLKSRWQEIANEAHICINETDLDEWIAERFEGYSPQQDISATIARRKSETELPDNFAMLYAVKTPNIDTDIMKKAFEHEFFGEAIEEDDVLFESGLGYVIGYAELSRRGNGSRYESNNWVAIGRGADGDIYNVEQRGDPEITSGHFDQEGILCVYQAFTSAEVQAITRPNTAPSTYTGLIQANRKTTNTPPYAKYRYGGFFKWIGDDAEAALRSAKMHYWRGAFHCLILKSANNSSSTPNNIVTDDSIDRHDALFDWLSENDGKNEKSLLKLFRFKR